MCEKPKKLTIKDYLDDTVRIAKEVEKLNQEFSEISGKKGMLEKRIVILGMLDKYYRQLTNLGMLVTVNSAEKVVYNKYHSGLKEIKPEYLASLLHRLPGFSTLKVGNDIKTNYIWDPEAGVYKNLSESDLKEMIHKHFSCENINLPSKHINEIYLQLTYLRGFSSEKMISNPSLVSFNNGTLNLKTKGFGESNQNDFITSKLYFNYDPEAKCDYWLKYLNQFCNEDKDRIRFLQCWLYLVLLKDNETNTFLYIVGRGGTGKSVFVKVVSLLIGEASVLATSLRDLTTDRFETANLFNKYLVICNDTEHFTGSLATLKQLTKRLILNLNLTCVDTQVGSY